MYKGKALGFCFVLIVIFLLSTVPAFADVTYHDFGTLPDDPTDIPDNLEMNWDVRHDYGDIQDLFTNLSDAYPGLTELYSIGTSWQERNLWCLEISNKDSDVRDKDKTGIGVFANIHGGEQESAESAIYMAWWLLLNSDDTAVQDILDNYIIYVVPLINPDGFAQSFVYNNRQNLRPTDRNNNGIPFSDPYTDINNDGWISRIYKGTASNHGTMIGWESPDWDGNGVLGDDPRSSTIDMNRSFDYLWNRYDIETYLDIDDLNTPVIGANAWSSAGPSAASEPEIQAVQNFLCTKPMEALVTLHTGEQSVLWPWCYRPYDENDPEDDDIPFMAEVGTSMAEAFTETSGRDFYALSSYEDYPTAAEMIDYAWGRLHIHAYTIEVYAGGTRDFCWGNTLPSTVWEDYSRSKFIDMVDDQNGKGNDVADALGLTEDDVIWFSTNSTAQMSGVAPEDQTDLVKGCRDAIITMIASEYDDGKNYDKPLWLEW